MYMTLTQTRHLYELRGNPSQVQYILSLFPKKMSPIYDPWSTNYNPTLKEIKRSQISNNTLPETNIGWEWLCKIENPTLTESMWT